MSTDGSAAIQQEIASVEAHLASLRARLRQVNCGAQAYQQQLPPDQEGKISKDHSHDRVDTHWNGRLDEIPSTEPAMHHQANDTAGNRAWPLKTAEYPRYSRQLILPEIGLNGQLRLKDAKVLVIGLGGLGCPASAYLAGAGVGTIGLMDGDVVETSNLHRQIIHTTSTCGEYKVDSAMKHLLGLNPLVRYIRHRSHLSPTTAAATFEQYDLILDCTDHPVSRYLISDGCVLTGKPLVSASAFKTEGQVVVLNSPPRAAGDKNGGPCYRCIFPKPPPFESVVSCSEGGILGPVVGIMGVLQALESIKLLTSDPVMSNSENASHPGDPQPIPPRLTLFMFAAYRAQQFHAMRLPSRRSNCAACSAKAIVNRETLRNGTMDYVAFCGVVSPSRPLEQALRISVAEFSRLPHDEPRILIDVRDHTQYSICSLHGSINIPWTGDAKTWTDLVAPKLADDFLGKSCYVICKLGNDSQLAVKALIAVGVTHGSIRNIDGGFKAWRERVDPTWPNY